MVAQLEACNVTNNGRHLGHHLRFYQVLKIKIKYSIFLCLTYKMTHNISTLHHFIHNRYFYCWEKLKEPAFSLKNGLTISATYDVMSRIPSNWLSLNLPENAYKRQTNSFWKRHVLIFYSLGKKKTKKKSEGGWQPPPLPPSLVRPRVKKIHLSLCDQMKKFVWFMPIRIRPEINNM